MKIEKTNINDFNSLNRSTMSPSQFTLFTICCCFICCCLKEAISRQRASFSLNERTKSCYYWPDKKSWTPRVVYIWFFESPEMFKELRNGHPHYLSILLIGMYCNVTNLFILFNFVSNDSCFPCKFFTSIIILLTISGWTFSSSVALPIET